MNEYLNIWLSVTKTYSNERNELAGVNQSSFKQIPMQASQVEQNRCLQVSDP